MYTEYVKNFDRAVQTINQTRAKNPRFAQVMDEVRDKLF